MHNHSEVLHGDLVFILIPKFDYAGSFAKVGIFFW